MAEIPEERAVDAAESVDNIPILTVPLFMSFSGVAGIESGNTQVTEEEAQRLWDELKDTEEKTQLELDAAVKKSRGHVDRRLALTKQLTDAGFTRYTSHGKKDRWLKD